MGWTPIFILLLGKQNGVKTTLPLRIIRGGEYDVDK